MSVDLEFACDKCGVHTADGDGYYPNGICGDRLCKTCLDTDFVRVTTAPCRVCGGNSVLRVPTKGYAVWRSGQKLIQDAFPNLSVDDRELLMSGTHPECWNNLFPKEES